MLGLVGLVYLLAPVSGWTQADDAPADTSPTSPPSPIEKPAVTIKVEEAPRPVTKKSRNKPVRLGDRVIVGNDLVVKEDETAGQVVVVGGSADIRGKVNDLIVVMGSTRLGPKAEVRHEMFVLGGRLDIDPAAKTGHNKFWFGGNDHDFTTLTWPNWPSQWLNQGLLYGRVLPLQYKWSWVAVCLAGLLYMLLALLFPRSVQSAVDTLEQRPGPALVSGMLAFMLIGPLLILLVITVIGVIAVPFAAAAFLIAFLFGKVAVYRYAGQQLGLQCGAQWLQHPLLALMTGLVLFCVLYTIPAVGLVAWMIVAPLGMGAVLLTVFGRKRDSLRQAGAAAPMSAGASAPLKPEPPALLPPAGFWVRFVASLLDLLLVGLILTVVLHHPGWFLLTWVLYHLIFWSWRGATAGGLLLGLSIVRVDGRPMNVAVALIRLLGAFFSLAALGLGFLWAGWSTDKQSWHDRISGTLIVKTPRPIPRVAARTSG